MANKKITELPYINKLSGSTVQDNPILNTVVPVVLYGTTNQISIENFSKFVTQYSADTGSIGNTFYGPQTINNNVTINGRLIVHEVVANYETASILFSTGSTKLGDQITDKHEFTGSTNITGALTINSQDYTFFSSSNSATFTNYSSSTAAYVTNLSSSNSATFTNFSSSNAAYVTNLSSSNSVTFTDYSSSNAAYVTNLSSSNSATFTNYSGSTSTLITNYSSSINTTIYTISSSINDTLFAVSASINTNIYAISSSINNTINANLGATNDVIYRIQQATSSLQFATASIQAYTASLKQAITVHSTNADIIGNFRVSGSTTLGNENTDKVEITGSVNVTGYVSASGLNIYSAGVPEIISSNNLRLTADSSVIITTDNSVTPKVWDFDNAGTINLPGGSTISTPNTIDVIVAPGTMGTSQLANYNKTNFVSVDDNYVTVNVDAGAFNQVWQYTAAGALNIPGSIIKPDGGNYTSSLTLTSSFHAFTASIVAQNTGVASVTASLNAFTASQLDVNLGVSVEPRSLNDFTASARIELNSIEEYTASLKNAISVSGTNVQIIGDLNVNKLNVQYVSSSVLVTSGSNTFGDQSTDRHEFTGSVYLQNSLFLGNEVLGNAGLNSFTASTNNSIVGVSAFTSSQLDVNLQNSIVTSSFRIELNSIEAYTASLKAAAIVSSSTQISNYYKFAETASANIFYGNQTISGSLLTNGNTFISGNLTISGSINSVKYVDFPQWDSTTQPGRLSYDTGEGTLTFGLSGGNLDLPIGVVNFETCYNEDSSSISKGEAVRVTGAQGNRVAVKKAHAQNDEGSAEILGLAAETIGVGTEGKIITSGPLKGLDTSTYTEGQKVYLSTTAGAITVEKPQAPVHLVWLGVIQRVHASIGIINIKIQNGYEIEELHDVRITTASLADKQLLVRSGSVWANQTIANLGIATTGSNIFVGNETISGSLLVSGSSHTIQNGYVILQQVSQSLNYVDDAAAAAAGVPLGGLYRNGNFIVIRIS